jgi:hypothetical protein
VNAATAAAAEIATPQDRTPKIDDGRARARSANPEEGPVGEKRYGGEFRGLGQDREVGRPDPLEGQRHQRHHPQPDPHDAPGIAKTSGVTAGECHRRLLGVHLQEVSLSGSASIAFEVGRGHDSQPRPRHSITLDEPRDRRGNSEPPGGSRTDPRTRPAIPRAPVGGCGSDGTPTGRPLC